MRQIDGKTRLFVLIVVCSNVLGNGLLSAGMKGAGTAPVSPAFYVQAFLNPLVAAGICVLIVNLLSLAALMSWADLSYAVPMTALAYVLTALVGKVFLDEHVPLAHWVGIALIAGGVGLVSRTAAATRR